MNEDWQLKYLYGNTTGHSESNLELAPKYYKIMTIGVFSEKDALNFFYFKCLFLELIYN